MVRLKVRRLVSTVSSIAVKTIPPSLQPQYYRAKGLICINSDICKAQLHVGHGSIFNPTIIKSDPDRLSLIARRVVNNERYLEYLIINKVDNIAEWRQLIDVPNTATNWFADPRSFIYRGEVYITYNTGHSESPNRIFVHKLTDSGAGFSSPAVVEKSGCRRAIEKNWGFFEFRDCLFAIYTLTPFTILKFGDAAFDYRSTLRGEEFTTEKWGDQTYRQKYGEPRGGASPVFAKGFYYCFFQSHKKTIFGDVYTGGVFVFKYEGAFRPVAIGKKPLFILDQDEFNLRATSPLNRRIAGCLYVTGAKYSANADEFEVSYGINDYAIGYCTVSRKYVDSILEAVR